MAFPSLDRFLARKHTKICIAYLLAASAYIIVSGWLVVTTVADGTDVYWVELLKGLGFVLVTSILLWVLLDRAYSSRMFVVTERRQRDEAGPHMAYLPRPFRGEELARTLRQVFGEQ